MPLPLGLPPAPVLSHGAFLFMLSPSTMVESESEVAQLCPTLWDPMDCSLPDSSVHGIFQAGILEWVAIFFSRGSSWPRYRTWVYRAVGRRFTVWATRLPQAYLLSLRITSWSISNVTHSHSFNYHWYADESQKYISSSDLSKNITPHVQLSMGSIQTESPQTQSDQIQTALPFPTNLFFLYPVVGNHIRNLCCFPHSLPISHLGSILNPIDYLT